MACMAEMYSKVNCYKFSQGLKLIEHLNIKRGQRVLDIGCGTGKLTACIASKVGEEGKVLGVDPDYERISIARKEYMEVPNITFLVAGICDIPQEYSFDVIFSNSVLQKISNTDLVSSLKRIREFHLNPEGVFGSQVPLKEPVFDEIIANLPEEEKHIFLSEIRMRSCEEYEAIFKNAGFAKITWEIKEYNKTFKDKEALFHHLFFCSNGIIDASKVPPDKRDRMQFKTTQSGEIVMDSCMVMWQATK